MTAAHRLPSAYLPRSGANRRFTGLVGIVVALVMIAAACGDKAELVGYEISPAPQVGQLTAIDASDGGSEFPLRAAAGRLLIMFLGYTNCPDACPTSLAKVRRALEQLGDEASRVDFAMLTVDPVRDTPQVLTDFVHGFVDRGHALRVSDDAELGTIVQAFGASSAVEHDHTGDIQVGHTDYTYVVDDTGAVVLTWTTEMAVNDLINDLEILIDGLSK